jgi:hypothetical protein
MMAVDVNQLALDFDRTAQPEEGTRFVRCEPREEIVRLVEYAPFPRVRADQHRRVGFTRDLSAAGMCLATVEAAPVGSLLHVVVRCADGRPTLDSLARAVWTRRLPDGEYLVGLALLGESRIGLRKVLSAVRTIAVA